MIDVYSVKGGQGCSTSVAVLGLTLVRAGHEVTLMDDGSHDLHRILGTFWDPEEERTQVCPGLAVVGPDTSVAQVEGVLIRDVGLGWDGMMLRSPLLVTRACYLALGRWQQMEAPRPDGVVLVTETGRPLDRGDVERVIGAPVKVEMPVDPAMARAIDSGLLVDRLPRAAERAFSKVSPVRSAGA